MKPRGACGWPQARNTPDVLYAPSSSCITRCIIQLLLTCWRVETVGQKEPGGISTITHRTMGRTGKGKELFLVGPPYEQRLRGGH